MLIDGAVVADGRPGRRSASVWRPFVRRLGDVDFQRLNDLWCASNSSVDDFMTMGKRRRNERRKGGGGGGIPIEGQQSAPNEDSSGSRVFIAECRLRRRTVPPEGDGRPAPGSMKRLQSNALIEFQSKATADEKKSG